MAAEEAKEAAPKRVTERRALGDLKVSPLALGTWQFGDPSGTYTKQSADTEAQIVKNALDSGINFFDTAEGYGGGESERSLGAALRASGAARGDYVVATKINNTNCTPDKVAEACDRSLANLGLDYIDLYQIHWPSHDIPIKDTMTALKALVDTGKVKHVGVSNFGKLDMGDLLEVGIPVVSNQLPYSLVARPIEDEILPLCMSNSVGVLAYSPLAQGLLTGKYASVADCPPALSRSRFFDKSRSAMQRHNEAGCEAELFAAIDGTRKVAERLGKPMAQVALGWAIVQPGVTSVLFGASRPDQVFTNAAAALEENRLDEATLAELTAASEPVRTALAGNPDLWDAASAGRYR